MRNILNVLMATSIAFAAVSSTVRAGSRSDLGQQLQLTLQEANNIYTRASKAQSDVSAKYNQRDDGIAQNFK